MPTITVTSPLTGSSFAVGQPVPLSFTVTDSAPGARYLKLTYSWGDGSPAVEQDNFGSNSPQPTFSVIAAHMFGVGVYTISISASNFLQPYPQTVQTDLVIEVVQLQLPVAPRIIFGPILPADVGFPNASQWNLSSGVNEQVLVSSLKAMILTAKGERLMEPGAGTNLRNLLFEPNVDLQSAVSDEIRSCAAVQEPRVTFVSAAVEKPDARSLAISATFTSNLNDQPVLVNVVLK